MDVDDSDQESEAEKVRQNSESFKGNHRELLNDTHDELLSKDYQRLLSRIKMEKEKSLKVERIKEAEKSRKIMIGLASSALGVGLIIVGLVVPAIQPVLWLGAAMISELAFFINYYDPIKNVDEIKNRPVMTKDHSICIAHFFQQSAFLVNKALLVAGVSIGVIASIALPIGVAVLGFALSTISFVGSISTYRKEPTLSNKLSIAGQGLGILSSGATIGLVVGSLVIGAALLSNPIGIGIILTVGFTASVISIGLSVHKANNQRNKMNELIDKDIKNQKTEVDLRMKKLETLSLKEKNKASVDEVQSKVLETLEAYHQKGVENLSITKSEMYKIMDSIYKIKKETLESALVLTPEQQKNIIPIVDKCDSIMDKLNIRIQTVKPLKENSKDTFIISNYMATAEVTLEYLSAVNTEVMDADKNKSKSRLRA
ncbi:MAG: hypothetical protein HOL58_07415 [Francisellaceae bacterium]|nr:hypothetical protein [Francisellaceae bacterium]